MPIIHTPKELGLTIRARRKELGWDQATLAKHVGVTRQWVIEIEKGKPRAELGLALHALRALGLSLHVDAKQEASAAPGSDRREHPASGATPNLDINAIVERNRGTAASRTAGLPNALAELPRTSADERGAIELARGFDHPAGMRRPADDGPGSMAGVRRPEGKRKAGGSATGKPASKRVSKRSGSKK